MRSAKTVVIAALLSLFVPLISHAKNVHSHQLPPHQAKVIVTFEGEIQPDLVAKYGEVLTTLRIINGLVAVIDRASIHLLRAEPGVKDVGIVAKVRALDIERRRRNPNYRLDSSAGEEGALGESEALASTLDLEGIILEWNLQEPGIAAEETWNTYGLDGSGVVIAILDTGVNYNLLDLDAPNYLGGYDFYNDDSDPKDDNSGPGEFGHGTIVSTIAVAQGEEKIVGAAPRASYYAIKVLGSSGQGDSDYAIQALDWCVNVADPRPDIINMSFGTDSPGSIEPYRAAVNAAYDAGIILVAASGNEGDTDSGYPAANANVISVGGHAEDQTLYDSSNGGVDVLAPGEWVPSMTISGDVSYLYSGTSNAAPHVAGLLALQLQYARQRNLDVNNGYQFESLKHSALGMPLIPDPDFSGKGKARAKDNVDLLAAHWPLTHIFAYSNETDWYWGSSSSGPIQVPVYDLETTLSQDIAITNVTSTLGNYTSDIENLSVSALQQYFEREGEFDLPGSPLTTDTGFTIPSDNTPPYSLTTSYYLPALLVPGLNKTNLSYSFNFVGETRQIEFTDTHASLLGAVDPNAAQCSDGFDNDGDGLFDYPNDRGCTDASDSSEREWTLICDDGIDNDGDTLIDYPDDPGCYNTLWVSENPQCMDGIDNDGDTLIDYPDDPACVSAFWFTEISQCQNGIDDDGDGMMDYDAGLSVNGYADPGGPDPKCVGRPGGLNEGCGLGVELALLLPPLLWLWRRHRS